MWLAKNPIVVLASILVIYASSCHRHLLKSESLNVTKPVSLIKRDVQLVLVSKQGRSPLFIQYHKTDVYNFNRDHMESPFIVELLSNPNMYNPNLVAKVYNKGKLLRQFNAKKSLTTVLSNNNTAWSPLHSKLLISIPFVKKDETIEVTTSYDWMNMRYMEPIFLQENGPIEHGQITVDVPYGITMHFQASKEGVLYKFTPLNLGIESKVWQQEDNKSGLGQRYIWNINNAIQSNTDIKANQLQLFLSFDAMPAGVAGAQRFDSWQAVSSYLYERTSGYDVPSAAIKEQAKKITSNVIDDEEKIRDIFAYLAKINKRVNVVSYLNQEVQPATLTYARNFGSPFDIVILGKAMLSSIGINADVVVAADKKQNPYIKDCFNPALFHSVVLAATVSGKTIYFDPLSANIDQLSSSLQGQHALLMRPLDSTLFLLPYDSPDKNKTTFAYHLYMTESGVLEGEYSFDVIGYDVARWHDIEKESKFSHLGGIESKLLFGHEPVFSFDTIQVEQKPNEVRFNGTIKPFLLTKNDQNDFELPLKKIIEPVIVMLEHATEEELSRTMGISLFISLPEHLNITSIPQNSSLGVRNLEGHFYFEFTDNKIMIESVSMIQLPVDKNIEQKLRDELKKLDSWQEFIIIRDDRVNKSGNDNVVPDGVFLDEEEHKDQANP